MLGFIKDYTEVGYYNNALHLSRMLLIVVTSLSVVSVPRFSSYINKGMLKEANGLANKSFSFVGLLAFPISIGLICITPTFVPWFFGKEFYGAIDEDEYNELYTQLNTIKNTNTINRNSVGGLLNKVISDLPANAEAAAKIVENFDPNQFKSVVDFATWANGGRSIVTNQPMPPMN